MMSRLTSFASRRAPHALAASGAARFGTLGVLATLFAVAWVGCGPGSDNRYYCDSTGCFECDAYGCTTVHAPERKPCTGGGSCETGSLCTASGCAQSCSNDVPCGKGEVCKGGLCASPSEELGGTIECTAKADCPNGTCVAGACRACGGTAGPCPCSTATDCSSPDQICVSGLCTAPTNTCTFSSECGQGKVCADSRCLTSCEAAPCSNGAQCEKGVCVPPTTPTCSTDAECSGNTPRCMAGSCRKACASGSECGTGEFCDQGACIVDTRPKSNCTDDSQCGGTATTPKKCMGGFCKFTCTAEQGDAYCRTIDNRIGSCAKDLVCRSAAEANAACRATSDCTGGKNCIDNQCR